MPTLILPTKLKIKVWGTKTLIFSSGTPKVGSIWDGIWGTETLIFIFGAPKVGSIRVGIWGTKTLFLVLL